jgi:hypothetical protein
MNSRTFYYQVLGVIGMYAIGIVLLAIAKHSGPDWFEFAKSAVPFYVAGPVAWFGYCFQRRQAYLKDVRELWNEMVEAVQEAIQYTYREETTYENYSDVLKQLSVTIEKVRAVFPNVGANEQSVGLFPFEPLKDIQKIITYLSWGSKFRKGEASASRTKITTLWKSMRTKYLDELERSQPLNPDSRYIEQRK